MSTLRWEGGGTGGGKRWTRGGPYLATTSFHLGAPTNLCGAKPSSEPNAEAAAQPLPYYLMSCPTT